MITLSWRLKTAGIWTVLLLTSLAPVKWVKTKLPNGITVSIPDQLTPMTPDDLAQRFPSVRAPLGAFTNNDRLADFSINISATTWPDGDVDMAGKFFKASLQNLYHRVDFVDEGIKTIKKKKFIYFEFESRIVGERKQGLTDAVLKYTYIQYLVQKDRTLVFTFSCPKDLREEWQPVAHEMMNRIRVN